MKTGPGSSSHLVGVMLAPSTATTAWGSSPGTSDKQPGEVRRAYHGAGPVPGLPRQG
jgi:hypothetical protein